MENVQMAKDIILSIAAIATSSVAVYGIFKWRKEIEAKAHFKAAKKLLGTVYAVRNNFEVVRSPWLDSSEFPEGYAENLASGNRDHKVEADGKWYVYRNRIKPLTDAMNELDVCLLEGGVLWGNEVKEEGKRLNSSFNRLVRSIKGSVQTEYRRNDMEDDKDILRYRKDISSMPKSEDDLSGQIRSSVSFFETLLKSYLGR